ncbi:VP2 [Warrego virus]|uniref:Outer capsid protein VP2 n=1 Tax=Warrego virus TaxID=40062 RepID=A0A097I4E4_9REOV|nr:VP2 [Warrego virus]AIT55714.1 VP2 [Warrego virus]
MEFTVAIVEDSDENITDAGVHNKYGHFDVVIDSKSRKAAIKNNIYSMNDDIKRASLETPEQAASFEKQYATPIKTENFIIVPDKLPIAMKHYDTRKRMNDVLYENDRLVNAISTMYNYQEANVSDNQESHTRVMTQPDFGNIFMKIEEADHCYYQRLAVPRKECDHLINESVDENYRSGHMFISHTYFLLENQAMRMELVDVRGAVIAQDMNEFPQRTDNTKEPKFEYFKAKKGTRKGNVLYRLYEILAGGFVRTTLPNISRTNRPITTVRSEHDESKLIEVLDLLNGFDTFIENVKEDRYMRFPRNDLFKKVYSEFLRILQEGILNDIQMNMLHDYGKLSMLLAIAAGRAIGYPINYSHQDRLVRGIYCLFYFVHKRGYSTVIKYPLHSAIYEKYAKSKIDENTEEEAKLLTQYYLRRNVYTEVVDGNVGLGIYKIYFPFVDDNEDIFHGDYKIYGHGHFPLVHEEEAEVKRIKIDNEKRQFSLINLKKLKEFHVEIYKKGKWDVDNEDGIDEMMTYPFKDFEIVKRIERSVQGDDISGRVGQSVLQVDKCLLYTLDPGVCYKYHKVTIKIGAKCKKSIFFQGMIRRLQIIVHLATCVIAKFIDTYQMLEPPMWNGSRIVQNEVKRNMLADAKDDPVFKEYISEINPNFDFTSMEQSCAGLLYGQRPRWKIVEEYLEYMLRVKVIKQYSAKEIEMIMRSIQRNEHIVFVILRILIEEEAVKEDDGYNFIYDLRSTRGNTRRAVFVRWFPVLMKENVNDCEKRDRINILCLLFQSLSGLEMMTKTFPMFIFHMERPMMVPVKKGNDWKFVLHFYYGEEERRNWLADDDDNEMLLIIENFYYEVEMKQKETSIPAQSKRWNHEMWISMRCGGWSDGLVLILPIVSPKRGSIILLLHDERTESRYRIDLIKRQFRHVKYTLFGFCAIKFKSDGESEMYTEGQVDMKNALRQGWGVSHRCYIIKFIEQIKGNKHLATKLTNI